jgi:hypothetical protein
MSKVNKEIAISSVKGWLDYKRLPAKKREDAQSMIDVLVDAVEGGVIVIDEDDKFAIKHKLNFPLESDGVASITELRYRSRITDAHIRPYKNSVKGQDFDASLTRAILALTQQPMGVIDGLDKSTDRQIAESIAVFFV